MSAVALVAAAGFAACTNNPVSQTGQSPAAQPTGGAAVTPGCDSFTKEDAEKALGKPVGEGQGALGACTYAASAGENITVAVIRHGDPSTARTAYTTGLKIAEDSFGGIEPVSGLGDEASYLAGGNQLWVLEGAVLLQVTVIGPQDAKAATRVAAEIVLGRI